MENGEENIHVDVERGLERLTCNPGRNPVQDLQDFLGSYKILQHPVSSHRILPRILNGKNPNHV